MEEPARSRNDSESGMGYRKRGSESKLGLEAVGSDAGKIPEGLALEWKGRGRGGGGGGGGARRHVGPWGIGVCRGRHSDNVCAPLGYRLLAWLS